MLQKFFFSFVLLLSFTLNAQAQSFPDVDPEHPFAEALEWAAAANYIQGYPDENFYLNNHLNRAELSTIVIKLLIAREDLSASEVQGSNCFPDVGEEWYAAEVCTLQRLNLIQGYANGFFQPSDPINFVEISQIFSGIFALEATEQPATATWYADATTALAEQKAIPVSIASYAQLVTRGEAVEMLYRLQTANQTKESALLANFDLPATEILSLNSCAALTELLSLTYYNQTHYFGRDFEIAAEDEGLLRSEPMPALMQDAVENLTESLGTVNSKDSEDFAQTNTQVAGVDEADILKTDGEYFYFLQNNLLYIIQGNPLTKVAQIDLTTETGFRPQEIFVTAKYLIVLGQNQTPDFDSAEVEEEDANASISTTTIKAMPIRSSTTLTTQVLIYDLTDQTNPTKIENFQISGAYQTARLIDTELYLVTSETPRLYPNLQVAELTNFLPKIYLTDAEESQTVACQEIAYFPGATGTQFVNVVGVDVAAAEIALSQEVILTGANLNIYVSQNNLFLTAETPPPVTTTAEFYYRVPAEEITSIYKFALANGEVAFQKKGTVIGTPLNQFSLDEFAGNLRITTTEQAWDSLNSQNNLFILNADLNLLGELRGLAPGEEIYSTRFLGEQAFVVTFRQVDPFFVLDLADPTNPQVLGQLKIPGYSDYLHPYDATHILGFGKEAIPDAKNPDLAWHQGLKIALFDVTDPTQPLELFKVVIGERGTDSELLHNHKALLFSAERELLGLPIQINELPTETTDPSAYGEPVFQGALLYQLNLTEGFTERAKITHFTEADLLKLGHYFHGPQRVSRLSYLAERLFVFSAGTISAHDLNEFALPEIERLDLSLAEEAPYSSLAEYNASLDYSCRAPTDCVVKNVGNCCGYYPQCVNVATEVYPDFARETCAAEGVSSVCGFPTISGCACEQSQCVGTNEE